MKSAPADRVPRLELADPEAAAAIHGPAHDGGHALEQARLGGNGRGPRPAALLGQEEPLEQVSQLLLRHEVELEKGVAQAEPGLSMMVEGDLELALRDDVMRDQELPELARRLGLPEDGGRRPRGAAGPLARHLADRDLGSPLARRPAPGFPLAVGDQLVRDEQGSDGSRTPSDFRRRLRRPAGSPPG